MNDAQKIIQNELDLEENLLWAGKPKQGIVFRKGDIYVIPLSLLWGGMVLQLEISLFFIEGAKKGIIFAHLFYFHLCLLRCI